MKKLAVLVLMVLVAGCAPRGALDPSGVLAQARGPQESRRLHTELVRKMIEDGRLYAALAHLEAQVNKFGATPASRLLRANVLRKLGRYDKAIRLYNDLFEQHRFRGRVEHGLGLIEARTGDLGSAVAHLRRAAKLRPTDAQIRNDLGYALLKLGQRQSALRQLATAYQLQPGGGLSANNYIVALLLTGHEQKAMRVAAAENLSGKALQRLRQQAEELKTHEAPVAATARVVQPPRIGVGGG